MVSALKIPEKTTISELVSWNSLGMAELPLSEGADMEAPYLRLSVFNNGRIEIDELHLAQVTHGRVCQPRRTYNNG